MSQLFLDMYFWSSARPNMRANRADHRVRPILTALVNSSIIHLFFKPHHIIHCFRIVIVSHIYIDCTTLTAEDDLNCCPSVWYKQGI